MNENKITAADLAGKGVVGLPDVPGLSTQEMQHRMDELALEVLAPKHNALIDALEGPGGADGIGCGASTVGGHIAGTANPHAVTASQVGAYTKDETDAQISARITDIGSADMTREVYDADNSGVVDDAERLGGNPPAYYATAQDAFKTYTHSCADGVHQLQGNGDNIRFVASAPYVEDETFTVNGSACTARTADGEPLAGGHFAAGAVVVCYRDGDCLNFSSGGAAPNFRILSWQDIEEPPAAARENDIIADIQTPAKVVWAVGTLLPGDYETGTVWVKSLFNESTRLDLSKRAKTSMLYEPVAVLQKDEDDWRTVSAKIYKEDGWVDIKGEIWLMDGAETFSDITGGYLSTAPDYGSWYYAGTTPNPYYLCPTGNSLNVTAAVMTFLPVDLSGLRFLEYTLTGVRGFGGSLYGVPNNFLYVTDVPRSLHTTNAVASYNDTSDATQHKASLDVSMLQGPYYIGLGMTQRSTVSNGFQWFKLRGVY